MKNLQTSLTAYYTETNKNPGAETGIDLLSVFETEIENVKQEMLSKGITFDDRTRDDTEKYITNKVLGEPLTINALMDDLSEKVQKILQVENLEDVLQNLNIKTQKLEGRILPPDILERKKGVDDGEKYEKKEKVKLPKLSLFLSALREIDIYTDDIIVRIGKVNTNEARNESYIAIEIPRLNKTVFLSNEYGEASFVFTGFISDEDLMDHGKQDFIKSPQFLSRIAFMEGKEDEWKVKMQEVLNKEEGEKNEKVDIDLLESVREFFSYLGAEEWIKLTQKEKKILDKRLQKEYNLGMSFLCRHLDLERADGKRLRPQNSAEAMVVLGERIFGKHKIFDEYREKIEPGKIFSNLSEEDKAKKIFKFLKKNNYTVERWIGLTVEEKKILDKKLQEEYDFGIFFLCTSFEISRIDGTKIDPKGSSEDMMNLGEKIFGKHKILNEYRKRLEKEKTFDNLSNTKKIEEIQSFLEKNNYTIEGWMKLSSKERKGLDKKIQVEYGFGIRSLCTKLALKRDDGKKIAPIESSEDMMNLGEKMFGQHKVFDEQRKKLEKEKTFDNLSEAAKTEEIKSFLDIHGYHVEGWMDLNQKEKKDLNKKIQEKYDFGIRYLCAKLDLGRLDGKQMGPISSSEDMMNLGEKIFGQHKVFDEQRRKLEKGKIFDSLFEAGRKEEIKSFLGVHGYTVEGWMELNSKEKKDLERKLQGEYNFGIRYLCTKLGLKRKDGKKMQPIGSPEDRIELGEKIFGQHKIFNESRKKLEKGKNFDKMSEEKKIEEIRSFLGKNSYTVEGWMGLKTREKNILDKKIQGEYNFGVISLCTKLGLRSLDGGKMAPMSSSVDMRGLGEKIFGNHKVFYEHRIIMEREKIFDRMSETEKLKEIQDFLGKTNYTTEGWMALRQKEKKELELRLQEEYNFGLGALCTMFGLKRDDEQTMQPTAYSKDMRLLGEKIFNKKLS